MPKTIDDIRNTILTGAKRKLLENGYSGMTLRSVAADCGIAVGTIYNYFDSKDTLIASFMLDDWNKALERVSHFCNEKHSPLEIFAYVFEEIRCYSDSYATLFADDEARRSAGDVFFTRHITLRTQIAAAIADTCRENAKRFTPYLPDFIAESILAHALQKRNFNELSEILGQLFE